MNSKGSSKSGQYLYSVPPSGSPKSANVYPIDSAHGAASNQYSAKPGEYNIYFDDKFFELKNEVDKFQTLELNWDGYNAIPVKKEIGKIATNFITILDGSLIEKISDIFPNSHGTITIEWENLQKGKLALEIGQTNYSYFVKQNNKQPILANGENPIEDFKKITGSLGNFYREDVS
jgi:hypothetical protein